MIEVPPLCGKGVKTQGFHQIISDLKALGVWGGQPRRTLPSVKMDGKDSKQNKRTKYRKPTNQTKTPETKPTITTTGPMVVIVFSGLILMDTNANITLYNLIYLKNTWVALCIC